jgi:diadenosine tetraphosphate (Ap4A) HIT family hydrolase
MKKQCCICQEIESGFLDKKYVNYAEVEERILWETNNFIVVPSISPICEDHLLLFPKLHISSLAQLSYDYINEFIDFTKIIFDKLLVKHESMVMFEHGVGKGQNGGCGIDHAHLHFLPLSINHFNASIIKLTDLFNSPYNVELKDIKGIPYHANYIIIGNNVNNLQIYRNEFFESQTIRKILCNLLNIDTWDWKELTNENIFRQTVQFWHYSQFA